MTDPKETFTSSAATEWQPARFPGVFLVTLPKPVVMLKDA